MKTLQVLQEGTTYRNGTKAYLGDINRYYDSALRVVVNYRITKAPDGAQVILKSKPEVIEAMKSLPFGRIGAIKQDYVVPPNATMAELLIPTSFNDLSKKKEQILILLKGMFADFRNMHSNGNGNVDAICKALDKMDEVRDVNQSIRSKWRDITKSLPTKFDLELLQDKKREVFKDYTSLCDYCVVIDVTITHVVNNPKLDGFVEKVFEDEDYDILNYKESKVRKVASEKLPVRVYPLIGLAQFPAFADIAKKTFSGNDVVSVLGDVHEILTSENSDVDFSFIKEHDKKLSAKVKAKPTPQSDRNSDVKSQLPRSDEFGETNAFGG